MIAREVGAINVCVIPSGAKRSRGTPPCYLRDCTTGFLAYARNDRIFLALSNDRRLLHLSSMFREFLAKHLRQAIVMQNIHIGVVLPGVVVPPRLVPPAKANHR